MKSILEMFYDLPGSWSGSLREPDSSFVKTAKIKSEYLDLLMAGMTDSQKELFENYSDADTKIEGMIQFDQFSYAFHLGAQLMSELMRGQAKLLEG